MVITLRSAQLALRSQRPLECGRKTGRKSRGHSSSLFPGRIVEKHLSWLGTEEYALAFLESTAPTVVILPYEGWERDVEYAVRITEDVKGSNGKAIKEAGGTWVLAIENVPPEVQSKMAGAKRAASRKIAGQDGEGPRFPGGQNILWKGGWTDPVTGLVHFRGRVYDSRTGSWLSPDPLGPVDSSNLYAGFAWQPHALNDPYGLTSRTHVKDRILYYTWNFGWVDNMHAYEYPDLRTAWDALQQAQPGQAVPFVLEMHQKKPGQRFYKQTKINFVVTAAESEIQRKQQLLFAFQKLGNDFETSQGQGIQGSQLANTLTGIFLSHEDQKIASSFSTEDLFSNLLAFHATVSGTTVDTLVKEHGGPVDLAEQTEFSLFVWDYLLTPKKGGQTEWAPVYIDPNQLPTADEMVRQVMNTTPFLEGADHVAETQLRKRFAKDLSQFREMLTKYQEKYGKPTLPEELKLPPLAEGVEIVSDDEDQ